MTDVVASTVAEAHLDRPRAPIRWRASVASQAWWLTPARLALLLWMPLTWLALSIPPAAYRTYYKTPKFIDADLARLMLLCTAGFVAGSFVAVQAIRTRPRKLSGAWLLYPGFGRWLYRIWLLGLVTTFLVAIVRVGGPAALLNQILVALGGERGSTDELKRTFQSISGLTSFTQLGMLVAMVEMLKLKWFPGQFDRRTSRRRIIAVLAFGLFRGVLISERLALVEIAVPMLVIWVRGHRLRSVRQAVLAATLPVLAAVALLYGFAATEYFRSYQFYKTRTDDSLIEFSRNRLVGYYATALNNSALFHQRAEDQAPFSMVLQATLDWPGVRSTLKISDPRNLGTRTLLEEYANPEFNNYAPPGRLAREWNSVYMTAVMVGFGALAGVAYAGYRFGSPGASVWFGVFTVAVIEFPRIWYLTSARVSAVGVVGLLAWIRYYRVRH